MAIFKKKKEIIEDNPTIGFGAESFEFSMNSMFRIPELLNYIMQSFLIRGVAGLACVALAFLFGVMFLVGSAGLIKGKGGGEPKESVVAVSQIESEEDVFEEETDETDETD